MPGGLRTPSVVDDGSEDPGVAAACGLDGVGSAQEEADGGGSGEQGEAGLGSYEARACDVSAGEAVPWSRAPLDPVPVVEALVEGEIQRAGGVGAAEAATVLPAEVVQATYERSAEDEGGRRGYVRGVPQLVGVGGGLRPRRQPERQHEVQEEGQQAQEGRQERPWQRRQ
eukprot:gene2715-3491_t